MDKPRRQDTFGLHQRSLPREVEELTGGCRSGYRLHIGPNIIISNANKDKTWNAEIMRNSVFDQVSGNSSCTSSESLQNVGHGDISFNEDKYIGGLFSDDNGEGLCSFVDLDSWDPLVPSQSS